VICAMLTGTMAADAGQLGRPCDMNPPVWPVLTSYYLSTAHPNCTSGHLRRPATCNRRIQHAHLALTATPGQYSDVSLFALNAPDVTYGQRALTHHMCAGSHHVRISHAPPSASSRSITHQERDCRRNRCGTETAARSSRRKSALSVRLLARLARVVGDGEVAVRSLSRPYA
jgi:hypothetical protein